ncbi:hypothetical protein OPV22_001112 [Ensete ventricosum]|uniref:Uncharacterized protein n=1 Tax=Ensete ventricosum TaxID=4639 RepID=A0AAV8RSZ2_ENSVE|nr:hypothetical protein OPV22_001112 [Ensete ventricosum]
MLKKKRADAHLRALAYRKAVTKLYNRWVRPRHVETGDLVLWKTEVSDPTRSRAKRLLVLDDRLPRQLGSGALQVLHGLQQLIVYLSSPDSRLPQQLLGVAHVAPNLLQFLLRDLAPEELLVSLPLGLLKLLPQLGRALFGLDDRLWSPFGFQSVKLFL